MSLLLPGAALAARRDALGSPDSPLAPLADSLASDLEPVLAREITLPREKARLTRRGGRCDVDGVLLEFDPFSPHAHRCPTCGRTFTGDAHYRWWVMGYHLWLSERAVHAAALFATKGDPRHRTFVETVLEAYATHYLDYPNRDNVLGPTRPFFSTYLESIWLLQLSVALDLLESSLDRAGTGPGSLGGRVRDRVVAPSAALIAGFDEGMSNRQVWNNAALLAAARLLARGDAEPLLHGPSSLDAHLSLGLLADGTWYEGENYHLFAHRGLWYGVHLAETLGAPPADALLQRFQEAYATPFVTALPDFTFPSRRDSQYRVSLRQWRFAELAELGLVKQPDDDRLLGALATLYDGSVPRRDTGRSRSTGEAERNGPPSALERADLGWRSLLHARTSLPPLREARHRSVLLAAQGYAVLRRDEGALYAALDYGHSGAGHGHPDRLNLVLVRSNDRWLDDVGTGSYVDPSLHWYRSTLAHNAPLVNGHSQNRVHGELLAFEDRGAAGWVRAQVDGIAAGVHVERAVVVMPAYLIDELTWSSENDVAVDLPIHAPGELAHAGPWRAESVEGGGHPEDGFAYLSDVQAAPGSGDVRLDARLGDRRAEAFIIPEGRHFWWRATAPGPPGHDARRFHVVRIAGRRGTVASVWSWRGAVTGASRSDGVVTVELADGTCHRHRGDRDGWHIELDAGGARSSIDLAGTVAGEPPPRADSEQPGRTAFVVPRLAPTATPGRATEARPLAFELGESHYRRSEPTWAEAGAPSATVTVAADGERLVVDIEARKQQPFFAPYAAENELDNEHPDVNSDGVQLHLMVPAREGVAGSRSYAWLLVPVPGSRRVRINERVATGRRIALEAEWSATSAGYVVRCAIPLAALPDSGHEPFLLDVLVNDMEQGRERRRGQLVLSGAAGEFVYLRGDRQPVDRHLAFVVAHG